MEELILVLAGLLSSVAVQLLQKVKLSGVAFWTKLPTMAKSVVALVVAEAVVLLNGVAGTVLGSDPFVWTEVGIGGLIVWLASMGWNALGKTVVKTVNDQSGDLIV